MIQVLTFYEHNRLKTAMGKLVRAGYIVCQFYEELDAILGTRAASAPPTLLESSEQVEDNILDGKPIDNEDINTCIIIVPVYFCDVQETMNLVRHQSLMLKVS